MPDLVPELAIIATPICVQLLLTELPASCCSCQSILVELQAVAPFAPSAVIYQEVCATVRYYTVVGMHVGV
jgi:hypothetical protein